MSTPADHVKAILAEDFRSARDASQELADIPQDVRSAISHLRQKDQEGDLTARAVLTVFRYLHSRLDSPLG